MQEKKVKELISKINELNKEIDKISPFSPAKVKGGKIDFRGTKEELEAVVELINTWYSEKETENTNALIAQRDTLEAQLKAELNKTPKQGGKGA